jgi:hypothetical protein
MSRAVTSREQLVPLRLRQESISARNLFHSRPDPLPEADLALAQALRSRRRHHQDPCRNGLSDAAKWSQNNYRRP